MAHRSDASDPRPIGAEIVADILANAIEILLGSDGTYNDRVVATNALATYQAWREQ